MLPFVGGNWKCFNDPTKNATLTTELAALEFPANTTVDVLVAPTSLHLLQVNAKLGSKFHVSAQDVNQFGEGAYTGSISAQALKSNNIGWTLIGHSERRTCFGEDDKIQATKVTKALEQGIKVVFCIGETKDERVNNVTVEVVTRQMQVIAEQLKKSPQQFVIAYEPVWSIGTGLVPTNEQIRDTHLAIRQWLVSTIGKEGHNVRILYGGSVKASNAVELYSIPQVNGFLVGGASLVAKDFLDIVKATQTPKKDEEAKL